MWTFLLLCVVIFIGVYLYNPKKLKEVLFASTKSNTNYVFITLYSIIAIIIVINLVYLVIDKVGNIVSQF